ncbi:protein phosphatase 2C domain-containing protein [Kitasatospora sp. NPDC048538]|uniref:protein phosphatase 2C domain-containing protein n=1 Tax=unclassified Kitasatospora TaxID=2633591 RepID=UPI0033D022D8
MSKQGAPAQPHRPEDGWWDEVYEGPAGTLPDTPRADAGAGSVDDWFATAAGLIGHQRTAEPEPEPESESDAAPELASASVPVPVPVPVPESESGPGPERVPVVTVAAAAESVEAPTAGREPGPEAVREPETEAATDPAPDELLERDSIDDWFDTAIGVIGQPRTPAETHRFPAPSFARDAPAPAPSPAPASEPAPPTVTLEKPAPEPAEPRTGADHAAQDTVPEPEPQPVQTLAPEPEPTPAPEPESEPADASEPGPEADPGPDTLATAIATATIPDLHPSPRPARATDRPTVPHVGERPPTYGPEPTAVPETDPGALGALVPDTALEGAQYGQSVLRAVSVRGDSARYRGEPRRDTLLITRFGDGPDGLLLAVLGGFERTGTAADEAVSAQAVATATSEACRQLAAAIGRSREGLAADLRDCARDRLRYGLQRLATSAVAPLRALAPREEGDAGADTPSPAALHCLLMSLDPAAAYRAAFGIGPGGLYLLRAGHWIDAYAARLLHHPEGQQPPEEPRPFRFRLVPATPGDVLLLCTPGLARPIADEPAVAHFLAGHWAHPHPPGTVDFLRQVQVRAKGYADDRTAAAIWTE